MDASSWEPYDWFPKNPDLVLDYMGNFNWNKPWEAGGQTASLPVFFVLEASRTMSLSKVTRLQEAANYFFTSIVDEETGSYFVPGKGCSSFHGKYPNWWQWKIISRCKFFHYR